ncbi:MAG: HEPN domain-containing protein [Thiohalospira sp.]
MQNEVSKLIEYRKKQAIQSIDDVELLILNKKFALAVNRIYYGMFYILLALSIKHGFKTSKHNQLIGWFNKEFVKTGKVDKEFGKYIHKAFKNRTDSDYGVFVEFEEEEVLTRFDEMKLFIKEIEKLLE